MNLSQKVLKTIGESSLEGLRRQHRQTLKNFGYRPESRNRYGTWYTRGESTIGANPHGVLLHSRGNWIARSVGQEDATGHTDEELFDHLSKKHGVPGNE